MPQALGQRMVTKASLIERIYLDIRRELTDGTLAPGKRVDIAALCARVGASKSPVRNALNRLVGEGLLETHAHDGFYRPLVTEAKLRDLYKWSRRLLLMAIDIAEAEETGPPVAATEIDVDDVVPATEQLFISIAALGQSGEILRAVDNVNIRLRAIRAAKHAGLIERRTELSALSEAYKSSRLQELRTLVVGYHALRLELTPQIVASTYREGQP